MMVKYSKYLVVVLPSMALAGCGLLGSAETADVTIPRIDMAKYRKMAEAPPNAPAGVQLEPATGTDNLKKLVASRSFGRRPDPFALLGPERNFEREQDSERLFQTYGGFLGAWTPPEEKYEEVEAFEVQPPRRLAGVVVSEGSVMILIDMADGKGMQTARAGSKLGEWTVSSIDTEKAILTRDPKKRPSQISVPLASPLDIGMPSTGTGAGTGTAPGGPMGGPRGGPPTGGPMGGPGGPPMLGGQGGRGGEAEF